MQWWKYKYATFWHSFVRRGMLPPENRAAIFSANGAAGCVLVLWGFLWDVLTHFSATRKELHPVDSIEANKIFILFFGCFLTIIWASERAHFHVAEDELWTRASRPSSRRLLFKWPIKAERKWGARNVNEAGNRQTFATQVQWALVGVFWVGDHDGVGSLIPLRRLNNLRINTLTQSPFLTSCEKETPLKIRWIRSSTRIPRDWKDSFKSLVKALKKGEMICLILLPSPPQQVSLPEGPLVTKSPTDDPLKRQTLFSTMQTTIIPPSLPWKTLLRSELCHCGRVGSRWREGTRGQTGDVFLFCQSATVKLRQREREEV